MIRHYVVPLLIVTACTLDRRGAEEAGGDGGSSVTTHAGNGSSIAASSGAGGSGATSTSSASVTTASVGSGGGDEGDCFDGQDGDNNGKTDCADPACAATAACAPTSMGWKFVHAVDLPPGNSPPPQCADGSAPVLLYETPAGPPACDACSCNGLMNAACDNGVIRCDIYATDCKSGVTGFSWGDGAPGFGPGCAVVSPVDPNNNAGGSCKITTAAVVTAQGTCNAVGGTKKDAPLFGRTIVACSAPTPGGGCNADACAPTLPTAEGDACILMAAPATCPAGWDVRQADVFTGGNDGRNCTPCSCKLGCTGGSFDVIDTNNCSGGGDPTVSFDPATQLGVCKKTPNLFDNDQASIKVTTPTATILGCPGGMGQGGVAGTGPTKLCCRS